MNATELGRRVGAETPFLKHVLCRMTRTAVPRANPGRRDGYQLARSRQTLSLSAVIQTVDGRDVWQQGLFDSTGCDETKSCRLSPT
ncbi:Rrf2 family transcriptional regulator [Candidatus Bipolaricaulota bacterium]|nr:Rrf2 family transcriptional regulator [Candidatus Bipolaricaulota bacterium]